MRRAPVALLFALLVLGAEAIKVHEDTESIAQQMDHTTSLLQKAAVLRKHNGKEVMSFLKDHQAEIKNFAINKAEALAVKTNPLATALEPTMHMMEPGMKHAMEKAHDLKEHLKAHLTEEIANDAIAARTMFAQKAATVQRKIMPKTQAVQAQTTLADDDYDATQRINQVALGIIIVSSILLGIYVPATSSTASQASSATTDQDPIRANQQKQQFAMAAAALQGRSLQTSFPLGVGASAYFDFQNVEEILFIVLLVTLVQQVSEGSSISAASSSASGKMGNGGNRPKDEEGGEEVDYKE